MGFPFSRKDIREDHYIQYYYPTNTFKYGRSKHKRSIIDINLTKQFLRNKAKGFPNKLAMMDVINRANTIHEPHFLRIKRPQFSDNSGVYTYSIDRRKLEKTLPDFKEKIEDNDETLLKEYVLSRQLKKYKYDIANRTFIKDEIIWQLTDDLENAKVVGYTPITVTPNMPLVPILPPLDHQEPLDNDRFKTYSTLSDGFYKCITIPLVKTTEKEKNIKLLDNKNEELRLRDFKVDILSENPTTEELEINVTAYITWTSNVNYQKIDFYNNYVVSSIYPKQKENESDEKYKQRLQSLYTLKKIVERINKKDPTVLNDITENQASIFYNWVKVVTKIKIDKNLFNMLDTMPSYPNSEIVKYITTTGEVKLAYIKNIYEYITGRHLDIPLTSYIPLKSGWTRDKYVKLALEQVGYKGKDIKVQPQTKEQRKEAKKDEEEAKADAEYRKQLQKHKYKQDGKLSRYYLNEIAKLNKRAKARAARKFRRENDQSTYSQFARTEEINYADVYQVINLYPFLSKENRANREWKTYLKHVLRYFDKLVEFSNKPNKTVNIRTPLGWESRHNIAMRLQGTKEFIYNKRIEKECYIKDNGDKCVWIFLAVPDYSLSTKEEKENRIYHRYILYGLNLSIFLGIRLLESEWFRKERYHYKYTNPLNSHPPLFSFKKYKKDKSIPDHFDDSYNKTNLDRELHMCFNFLPRMPRDLWFKIPYNVKKTIIPSTVIVFTVLLYEVEVGTWFGEMFGFILIVIGIVLLAFSSGTSSSLIKLGVGLMMSGLIYELTKEGIISGKIALILNIATAIYTLGTTSWASMPGFLANSAAVVAITSSVFAYYNNRRMMNAANDFQKEMNDLTNQNKSESEKLLENKLKYNRIDLTKYDVDTNYDDEIARMYHIAYGNVLYNDFYDKLAYNEGFKIYDEYDRFK